MISSCFYRLLFFFLAYTSCTASAFEGLAPLKNLPRGRQVYAFSQVEDGKKTTGGRWQSLKVQAAGQHKKACSFILLKLSQYERYSEFLGLVKKSSYNPRNQLLFLKLEGPLLPFNMALKFKMPHITKVGTYPFKFNQGFLKGLTGQIVVEQRPEGCFLSSSANWKGPHSKINSSLFQFFTQAIAKGVVRRLIEISRVL